MRERKKKKLKREKRLDKEKKRVPSKGGMKLT